MARVRIGERAPAFVLRTADGRKVPSADLQSRYVVLYFFPKAFTPG